MKKTILILTGLFATVVGFSQAGKSNGADASKPNSGIVEPTINGKPYSQYKAEQDALKQQQQAVQAAQSKVVLFADKTTNGNGGTPTKPVVQTEENTMAKTAPVSHKVVMPAQNAAVTTSTKTQVNQPKGDKDVVAEEAKVVTTSATQQTTNPIAPKMAPVTSADKTGESNSNGSNPAKVETKTADPVVPGANRKTD